jgi:hypothetical protein
MSKLRKYGLTIILAYTIFIILDDIYFFVNSIMVRIFTFKIDKVRWPGFESLSPTYIIHVASNWDNLTDLDDIYIYVCIHDEAKFIFSQD